MRKNNFIITAMIVNLTICITLCLVSFVSKDDSDKSSQSNKEQLEILESVDSKRPSNQSQVEIDETTSPEESQEESQEETTPEETTTGEAVREETTTEVQTTEAPSDSKKVYMTSDCNIRAKADTDSEKVGRASKGETYSYDPELSNDEWVAIKRSDGSTAYVGRSYVKEQ